MLLEFRRGLARGLGFWLIPILAAGVLAGGGMVAGYASAAGSTSVVVDDDPGASALGIGGAQRNGFVGRAIRLGVRTDDGRYVIFQDRSGRFVRVLVTAQTIVKRDGRRVAPTALRQSDEVVAIGTRDANGVFRAKGIAILP